MSKDIIFYKKNNKIKSENVCNDEKKFEKREFYNLDDIRSLQSEIKQLKRELKHRKLSDEKKNIILGNKSKIENKELIELRTENDDLLLRHRIQLKRKNELESIIKKLKNKSTFNENIYICPICNEMNKKLICLNCGDVCCLDCAIDILTTENKLCPFCYGNITSYTRLNFIKK